MHVEFHNTTPLDAGSAKGASLPAAPALVPSGTPPRPVLSPRRGSPHAVPSPKWKPTKRSGGRGQHSRHNRSTHVGTSGQYWPPRHDQRWSKDNDQRWAEAHQDLVLQLERQQSNYGTLQWKYEQAQQEIQEKTELLAATLRERDAAKAEAAQLRQQLTTRTAELHRQQGACNAVTQLLKTKGKRQGAGAARRRQEQYNARTVPIVRVVNNP